MPTTPGGGVSNFNNNKSKIIQHSDIVEHETKMGIVPKTYLNDQHLKGFDDYKVRKNVKNYEGMADGQETTLNYI